MKPYLSPTLHIQFLACKEQLLGASGIKIDSGSGSSGPIENNDDIGFAKKQCVQDEEFWND